MPRIYFVLTVLVSMTLLVANQSNPPNGKTGAPGDGLCTDCHTLNGQNQDGNVSVAGIPATITPSTAYILTLTVANPNGNADLAGFQMTILNSSNQKAGTMTSPSPTSTVSASGGRDYWEHNPAQQYPVENFVSWTVTWTSPAGPPNTTITAYAAGNVAKDNNNDSNDLIVTSTSSGVLEGGGDPLQVDIVDFTNVLCNGGNNGSATAGAIGGVSPYSYSWSNGGTMATINNLTSGVYIVTVTDGTPSTATTSIVITQPNALVLQNPTITNVSCFGGNNGSIQASATGGVSPYNFAWSNGSFGSTISGLAAGMYTVTVTDDNACTKTATYQVTQPTAVVIELVELTHETCSGENDGSITISVSGGSPPVFAEWSNGFVGSSISNLEPDTYSVTVTDINNCTKTASYTINPGSLVNVTLEDQQNVTCNGGNNGFIIVEANGGTAPYQYEWSNGETGSSITNLVAGSYLLTVTDDNDCEVVKVYTINQPGPITIQLNATDQNLCAGDSNVDLTAVVGNAQNPITAMWSNGVNGLNNNDLPAGVYTIMVTDFGGCTASNSATVTSPPTLVVNVITTDETGPDADDGSAEALASGGTPGYSYLWSNGSTTDSIFGLPPGTYTVTVTDQNNCTVSGTGQVDEFGCMLDIDLGPDVLICEGDFISLSASPGFVSYLWSTGASTNTIDVATAGEYCLTVVDAEGCQDVDCIVVAVEVFPTVTCPVIHESSPGANDGSITCDSLSGNISYLWSTGETTSSLSGLAPGEYCVTMTSINGCTGEQCFTVQPGGCQLIITSIITDALCADDTTGSISVSVENATPPVTFAWSNGDNDNTIFNLSAGEYSVTITDAAGCTEVRNYTVNEPAPLTITIDTIIDITDIDGAIFITVNGGSEPFTIEWTFPDGTMVAQEDLTILTMPGFYTVQVWDNNNCLTTASVLLEIDVAVNPVPDYKTVNVYPVPTQDVLFVQAEMPITEAYIIAMDGRQIKRIVNPSANMLQVGDIDSGIYILRMSDGMSWYIARMVK